MGFALPTAEIMYKMLKQIKKKDGQLSRLYKQGYLLCYSL
jgi:hypothetical protein